MLIIDKNIALIAKRAAYWLLFHEPYGEELVIVMPYTKQPELNSLIRLEFEDVDETLYRCTKDIYVAQNGNTVRVITADGIKTKLCGVRVSKIVIDDIISDEQSAHLLARYVGKNEPPIPR